MFEVAGDLARFPMAHKDAGVGVRRVERGRVM
jgi:hypothetical protein